MLRLVTPVLALALAAAPAAGVSPAPTPAPAAATPKTAVAPAARGSPVYRIETERTGPIYAADHPMQAGDLVSFHEYPSGTLVSMRRSEIRRVVVERLPEASRGPKPGEVVDIGLAGPGSASRTTASGGGAAGSKAPGLGERKDGTALLNPDRAYRPDIDSKQVPGLNMGLPNSANDYREGRTIGYPAAPAVQALPGDPPKMPDSKPN